jgi:nicotinamidase/pyrazinamidase
MKALILVDIQNDFLPGGTLAVPDGDQAIPVVNRLQQKFDLVVATQDWHPPGHGSFAVNHPGRELGDVVELDGRTQILWPVHCVQDTRGAELAAELDTRRIARIFRKGTDARIDSYSGFFDNGHRKATGLGDFLQQQGVDEVYIAGLATDYCVKFTALDSQQLGFQTHVIEDACRGVDIKSGDVERAIDEMRAAGVAVVNSRNLESC